jgi:hypothetical protein
MIACSVADRLNILLETDTMTRKCASFLDTIYRDFAPPVAQPLVTLRLRVKDLPEPAGDVRRLGQDGWYREGFLQLASGHRFERLGDEVIVDVPSQVKRGRVPFKRAAPGRHISDELVEPIMVYLLEPFGIRFLHSSAILAEDDNQATVRVAWRGTGKTNAILPFLGTGRLMSDDLTPYDSVAGIVHAYPRPLRLYSYNIERLPWSDSEKAKLRRKSYRTPPWQPVAYLPIQPRVMTTDRCEFIFLNADDERRMDPRDPQTVHLFDLVTDFELSPFRTTETLLRLAAVL